MTASSPPPGTNNKNIVDSPIDDKIVKLSTNPRERFAQLVLAGMPFDPLADNEIVGANLQRLKKSMGQFGWTDPRFVSEQGARQKGWEIAGDATSVDVSLRDGNILKSVSFFNAAFVPGMPSITAMLNMSDQQIVAMRDGAAQTVAERVDVIPRDWNNNPQRVPEHKSKPGLSTIPADWMNAGQPAALDDENTLTIGPVMDKTLAPAIGRSAAPEQTAALIQAAKEAFAANLQREKEASGYRSLDVQAFTEEYNVAAKDRQISVPDMEKWVRGETMSSPLELADLGKLLGIKVEKLLSATDQTRAGVVPVPDMEKEDTRVKLEQPGEEKSQLGSRGARLAVMAPYWIDGLHNHAGIALAKTLNAAIKKNGLGDDAQSIERLLALETDAKRLGLILSTERQLRDDPDHKANLAEPVKLLEGELVRDNLGAYRPAAGGKVIVQDQNALLTLNTKQAEGYMAAMELAKAKGWTSIELKGKPAMLSGAWLEAQMAGLEVVGYQPTEKDKANLAKRMAERENSKAKGDAGLDKVPDLVEIRPVAVRDREKSVDIATVAETKGIYHGPIVKVDGDFAAQSVGRGKVVWHRLPGAEIGGGSVEVKYKDGVPGLKAAVKEVARGHDR
jgi:hypothetical protein